MGNITSLIKDIASKDLVVQTCAAKVIKVNHEEGDSLHSPKDAYTVNVMRADGAILKNVRLKASIQDKEEGIIAVPKEKSWVLVSVIDGVETRAFVSQCSEVERTFVRLKNDDKQLLEIDTTADKLAVTFKATTDAESETPEYNAIATIEMNSLGSDTTAEAAKPNIITSFYDGDGKEVSKNTFTGTTQEIVLNTVSGDDIKERVKLVLTSEGTTSAELVFTDADGAEKQKLTFDETHTEISLNAGNTIFNLQDNDILLTTDGGGGYQAAIKDDNVTFNKGGDITFEMDSENLFTIKNDKTDLKTELNTLIDAVLALTVTTPVGPSGTPINVIDFTNSKDSIATLLT